MKNVIDVIGNRTRYLSDCSEVLQTAAPPGAERMKQDLSLCLSIPLSLSIYICIYINTSIYI